MATATANGTLYYGPSQTKYPSEGNINGTVTILWKEGDWYYVETNTNPRRRGYIPTLSNIVGGVTLFTPTLLTRYTISTIPSNEPTYQGPATNYKSAGSLGPDETVKFLSDNGSNTLTKIGDYAMVEYDITGSTQKKRAWFPHMKLTTTAPVFYPGKYIQGQKINSSGEKWYITNSWNGNGTTTTNGHLAIDVVRLNSSGSQVFDKEVYAVASGTVADKGNNSANGNYMVLKHTTNTGKIYYSLYYHLSSYYSKTSYAAGEAIGVMGNTGSSSNGEHVHLGITRNQPSGGYYGYYYVNGVKTKFTETGSGYFDNQNNRFYSPTKYFAEGESLINNNY